MLVRDMLTKATPKGTRVICARPSTVVDDSLVPLEVGRAYTFFGWKRNSPGTALVILAEVRNDVVYPDYGQLGELGYDAERFVVNADDWDE